VKQQYPFRLGGLSRDRKPKKSGCQKPDASPFSEKHERVHPAHSAGIRHGIETRDGLEQGKTPAVCGSPKIRRQIVLFSFGSGSLFWISIGIAADHDGRSFSLT
jgi:hypothetical protein